MARGADDDGASAGGDGYTYDDAPTAEGNGRKKRGNPVLRAMFGSCEEDALGSVHRAWAVTVLFMFAFFVVASVEASKLREYDSGAAFALQIAACWSALVHVILTILGTFILKRFSTAFMVGLFLGCSVVVSQQDLLLFVAFYHYPHGDAVMNLVFADLALALAIVLAFFSLILGHFRHHIIIR